MEVKLEEDEEEFRSCCADEEELKEREESVKDGSKNDVLDEFSVHMFFRGVSIAEPGNSGSGVSGIGVVMERMAGIPVIQVQKKLDFYVDETVANYLALMNGLVEATQNSMRRVFAFTDSEVLFKQITHEVTELENPLLMALRQRILELAGSLEQFLLKCVPQNDLERPLRLAQVAIGIVSTAKEDGLLEYCSICCEEKPAPMMITMKCSHKFCSNCMKTFVDGKVESSEVPIRCPHLNCRYYISTTEFRSFLPVASYELLEKIIAEANHVDFPKFYCPFPNCSVRLDPHEFTSAGASSSSHSENNCVECPVCRRYICVECGVPWHSSMSCEDYQELPPGERNSGDATLVCQAVNERWRRCQHCQRMIELTHGCYHMTCWCGHEFCYSCGAEYRDSQQTCQCAFFDEEYSEDVATYPAAAQHFEQWAWDSFGSLSTVMDAYSDQERSQLALIQRFLAGGFSLSDHHHHHHHHQPCQSPPRCSDSYVDTMKDLHQLPWLERFVSVITDNNYYDEYNTQ